MDDKKFVKYLLILLGLFVVLLFASIMDGSKTRKLGDELDACQKRLKYYMERHEYYRDRGDQLVDILNTTNKLLNDVQAGHVYILDAKSREQKAVGYAGLCIGGVKRMRIPFIDGEKEFYVFFDEKENVNVIPGENRLVLITQMRVRTLDQQIENK